MRLASFQITGLAVLQDLDVEVRDHLVVIAANDVGKTSIVPLLHHAAGDLGAAALQGLRDLTLDQADIPKALRRSSGALWRAYQLKEARARCSQATWTLTRMAAWRGAAPGDARIGIVLQRRETGG